MWYLLVPKKEPDLVFLPPHMLDYVGNGATWEDMMADDFSTHTDWRFLENTPLTGREQNVVKLKYGKGMTSKQTSRELKVTRRTITRDLSNIRKKLDTPE